MEPFAQLLRGLGTMRLAVIGAMTVALVGFFVWIIARLASPELQLLYGDLDGGDSAAVAAHLDSQKIPYELRDDGSAIYVPANMVAGTRVSLANEGLPSGGSIGYEIFDNSDTLGTTNFVQNVNLVRALEGELARTIRSVDGVRSARVHLVMPRRELFSRERQEPSASVALQMAGKNRLAQNQILAIQHLVASAVPGLNPNRISIIDDSGALLAGGFEGDDSVAALNARADDRRRQFENRMAQAIEQLLERTVGHGRVRAEVFADMDFDRINTSEEIYDPEGQVVRSTQAIEEQANSREGDGLPPVSVGTNLPDGEVDAGPPSGSESSELRTEETVNYEISKKVINHVREAGTVNKVSVAVLVDGTYGPGDEGPNTYKPRTQDELNMLGTLIRGAIGFDAERGDTVEIINMRFADGMPPIEEDLDLFFGLSRNDLLQLAQYLVLVIFALLVILLVVRPLLSRALEAMPSTAITPEGELLAHHGAGPGPPALAAPGMQRSPAGVGEHGGEQAPGDEELEEMIDLDRVEGRVKASAVRKVGEIVDKHPDEALSILRAWLQTEA